MKKPKTKTDKELWEFKWDDLNPIDTYYKISRPYRIWYEYLRISPTFGLAIKEFETNEDRMRLLQNSYNIESEYGGESTYNKSIIAPDDYADVIKFFKNVAWIDSSLSIFLSEFRIFWNVHGSYIFGYPYSNSVYKIITIPYKSDLNTEELLNSVNQYSQFMRKCANIGFALIAVPLTGKKKDAMASINRLFNENDFTKISNNNDVLYKLETGKQLDKLPIGLRVLWTKALNPDLPLWKVGLEAKITDNPMYTCIKPDLSKQSGKYKDQIDHLASMTSRKLTEALIIMENAARGRFPCNDPKLIPPFNKNEMLELVLESIKRRRNIEESRIMHAENDIRLFLLHNDKKVN